jgi:hypothetical protein
MDVEKGTAMTRPNATQTFRPDLAAAARAVEAARAEWERFDSTPATAEDIADAQDREAELRAELASLTGGVANFPTRARLRILEAIRATRVFLGLEDRHVWATPFLLGVVAVIAVAPFVLLARPAGATGATILLGAYLFGVVVVYALLLTVRLEGVDAAVERLRRARAEREARAADLVPQIAVAHERVEFLRAAHAAYLAHDEAVARHRRLETLLSSERFQLTSVDWRSLRGVPFEQFVARVFRALGYEVRTTPASNQGVDLIVTGYGRTIAVQTTGCADGVGNRAVQEVFAGRVFHKCDECCVVTNSHFTSGALALATEVNCLLVDGDRIPALIGGDVF